MELPENDDGGYEVDDSGEYVSESKDGLGISQLDVPTSLINSGGDKRRVHIHRSGSVTVMNAGEANNISAISHRSDRFDNTTNNYNNNNNNNNNNSNSNNNSLRLTNKIKQQASKLLQTQTTLETVEQYAKLCEKRILDFDPNHRFPVTKEMLGVLTGSRYGKSGNSRRGNKDLQSAHDMLKKQYHVAQKRTGELRQEVKELRQTVPQRDKTITTQRRKIEQLTRRVVELESFAVGPNARSKFGKTNTSAAMLADGRMQSQLAMSERESIELKSKNDVLNQSLRKEARLNEEQRVYVATLEAALKVKAGELGLEGHAELLAELARLRGRVEAHHRESQRSNASIAALEAEMDDIRKREAMAREREKGHLERVKELSGQLAKFNSSDVSLHERIKNLETEKTALLDYVEDTVSRTTALAKQVEATNQEKSVIKDQALKEAEDMRMKLQEEEDSKKDVATQLANAKGDISVLKQESLQLEEKLKKQIAENSRLKDQVNGRSDEMIEMQEIQNELLNTIREKSTALENLHGQCSDLQKDLTIANSERSSLQKELSMTTIKMETRHEQATMDLEAALKGIREELETMKSANVMLQSELDGLNEHCSTVETNLANETKKSQDLEKANATHKIDKERMAKLLEDLTGNQTTVEKQMEDMNKALEVAENELTTLRSYKEIGERVDNELQQLETLVKEQEENRNKNNNNDDRNIINESNEDLLKRFGHWSSSPILQQLCPTLSNFVRQQYSAYRDVCAELKGSQVHLEMERKEKVLGSRMLHDEIHSLRSLQDKVRAAQHEAEQEASKARSEAEGLQGQLRDKNSQIDMLNNDVSSLKEELEETRKSLQSDGQQIARFQDRLLSTEKALSASTRERDSLQSMFNETTKEFERMKSSFEQLSEEHADVITERDELNKKVIDAAEDATTLTKQNRRETQVMLEKITSLEAERDKLKTFSAEMKSKLETSTKDGDELSRAFEQEKQERSRLERLTSELEDAKRNEEASVSSVRMSMQNALSSAETQVSGLEAQVRNLEGRLQRATNEKQLMEGSVVSLTGEVESIRRTLQQSVDDICSRHGGSNKAVSEFMKRRTTTKTPSSSRRLYTPSKSRGRTPGTPSRTIVTPAVDGVRDSVRNITTLVQMTVSHGMSVDTQLQNTESELEQLRGAKEQVYQLEGEVQTLRLQIDQFVNMESRLKQSEEEVSHLRTEKTSESQMLRQEISYLRNQNVQNQAVEQELKRCEADRASQTERCHQLQVLVDRLRNEKTQATDNLGNVDAKVTGLQKTLATTESELITCRSDLASVKSQMSLIERRSADNEQRKKMLEQQLDAARNTVNDQRNQIQTMQHAQSQMENEITNSINSLQNDYQQVVHQKERLTNQLRQAEMDGENATSKVRALENARGQLETQLQQTVREKDELANSYRRAQNELQGLMERVTSMERERDSLVNDLQTARSELSSARNTNQEIRQREFQYQQEIDTLKRENSRLNESQMETSRKIGQLRTSLSEARSVGDAQKAVLQSKIDGLEQQLSSDTQSGAQKDLAIMELSQSLRRVESAISPPRGGLNLPVQTPGATPMISGSSFGTSSSYSSRPYNSTMKPYLSSASSKLASIRNAIPSSVPRKVHIHRSGSVTIGQAPMSGISEVRNDSGNLSQNVHISRTGSVSTTSSSSGGDGGGIQSLHERLANVQATFAKLKSSKK